MIASPNFAQSPISIIVPVFNGAKTLKRCVDSALNQKEVAIFVYLIVQESIDASLAIALEYQKKCENVFVMRSPKDSGVSFNRNLALREIEEGFVFFLDCDDAIPNKDALRRLVQFAEQSGAPIACGRCAYPDGTFINGETYISKPGLYSFNDFALTPFDLRIFVGTACGKMFSARFIKENNIFFEEHITLGEDNLFCYQCISSLRESDEIFMCDEVVYTAFLENENSLSRRLDATRGQKYLDMYFASIGRIHKAFGLILWRDTYWNYVQNLAFRKGQARNKIETKKLIEETRYFRNAFYKLAPKEYKSALQSKRKFLLELNWCRLFLWSLRNTST